DRRPAAATRDRNNPDPLRRESRCVLFIERLTGDAVWKPLERYRSAFQMRKNPVGYPDVEVDDLPFAEPAAGVEDLVEVRQCDAAAADIQLVGLLHVALGPSSCGTTFDRRRGYRTDCHCPGGCREFPGGDAIGASTPKPRTRSIRSCGTKQTFFARSP